MPISRLLLVTIAALSVSLPVSGLAVKSIKSLPIEFTSEGDKASDNGLDVNKATAGQLARLKGMNATRAQSIVKYRQQHGHIQSFYELGNIKELRSLNAKQLRQIEEQLKIG